LDGVQATLRDEQPNAVYSGLTDVRVIGGTSRIADAGWKVIAELPMSEAYAYLRSLIPLFGGQVLVGVALSVRVWFYVICWVVTPILEITYGAQLIGEGYLDHRLEVKTGGELADLASVFNSMTAKLQAMDD
jgi:methyl-accepting chemotaxis protein